VRNREERLLGVVFVALLSAFSAGCADLETGPVGPGETLTGSGGDGGHAGQGGQTGQTGSTDIGPIGGAGGDMSSGGAIKSEWVGSSGVGKSGSYRMEFMFGQPMNQGVSSSSSYRLQSDPAFAAWSKQ
jgi:hypothetical protein